MVEHWWERRMVAFDLETTSAEPEEARIVSAAIAEVGGGLPTQTWTALADPGVPIPDEAAEIHGITTERARAEGRPAGEVVAEAVGTLAIALAQGWPLVIFNAPYDLTVLDREARRHDLAPLGDRQVDLLVVDPLVLDKHLERYRRGSRKLVATCEWWNVKLPDAHDAAFDAIAAARLAWCLGSRGGVVRRTRDSRELAEKAELVQEWERVRTDLPLLHWAQRRWFRYQAENLAEYFRREGVDRVVPTEWPVFPHADVQGSGAVPCVSG